MDKKELLEELKTLVEDTVSWEAEQPDYAALEKRLNNIENRSGLMSKSWFSRAITVWGYGIGIQLIIAIIGLVLAGMFGYLIGN